jgi:hypothetical protein
VSSKGSLERVDDRRVLAQELKEFWAEIDGQHPGLSGAVGCYIFGVRTSMKSKPWYVGKTERRSFKSEAFQPHKLLLYQNDVLSRTTRGEPVIYLIARLTSAGKLRRAATGDQGVGSIARLEQLLIGNCLRKNSDLANKKDTSYLRRIRVPGYLNEAAGGRTREARALANLLA